MSAIATFIRRIGHLCRKELLAIVKDPANRVILIAPVLAQTLMFGYGASHDLRRASYALLDQSHSVASHELIARLDGAGVFQRVATLDNPSAIAGVIDSQHALMVVHIGPDFAERLASGQPAPVQLLLDGRNSTSAGVASAHAARLLADYGTGPARTQAPPALRIETRAWFNPNLETRWNIVPGLIAALSMVQTLLLAALSVAREREQGTFDQLLVTPLTPTAILIGKALPALLVGLVQASLVLAISLLWFRIPMAGALPTLYLGLLVFVVACVGLGLSISALSANMQQAMVYTFVAMMPLILLSGLITPVRNMPPALQRITEANPLRFALELVRRVYLEGAGLADVAPLLVPMLAVAAVTLPLAAWLFRNRFA